ncbi:splicing factor U2AF 50 kDa subunit [Drosophila takahashii]|uniref:splicing factor U2AF 50 kDa subunit n=1 Tax=Drosophila takahashii TaxID=29030 RepID=UPI001CF8AB4E|nr:splicing factor U2AF 50 kDa subunit [Drosophila takahashii]
MGRRRPCKDRSRTNRTRSRSRTRSPRPTRSDTIFTDRPRLQRRPGHAASSWDIPPTGYAHLTPLQYKAMQASGQIASRIVLDAMPTGESAAIAMVTRQARRLYVGNIPFGVTEEDMIEFFNQQIVAIGVETAQHSDGRAVLTCQTNLEKNFAFLEFRSMDEATQALNFDGINFRGQTLKIRRPHDYQPVASFGPPEPEVSSSFKIPTITVNTPSIYAVTTGQVISAQVPDSPNKIYVGGLPTCLNEMQIKELLLSFGELKGFNLVKESSTSLSKGFAFFEYVDPTVTETAIAGLNGMQLGDRRLVVQRSIPGGKNGMFGGVPVVQVPGISTLLATGSPSEVLCLFNMVLPEELLDEEEFQDIRTDIKQECTKYGEVRSIKIPRPIGQATQRGCGKVFVQFETVEDCQKALKALSGRKFSGRIVMTSFYDSKKYLENDLQ